MMRKPSMLLALTVTMGVAFVPKASAFEFEERSSDSSALAEEGSYVMYDYGLKRRQVAVPGDVVRNPAKCYINSTQNLTLFEYDITSPCCGTCTGRRTMNPTTCRCTRELKWKIRCSFNKPRSFWFEPGRREGFRRAFWRALLRKVLLSLISILDSDITDARRGFFERSLLQTGSNVSPEIQTTEDDFGSVGEITQTLSNQATGLTAAIAEEPTFQNQGLVVEPNFVVALTDAGGDEPASSGPVGGGVSTGGGGGGGGVAPTTGTEQRLTNGGTISPSVRYIISISNTISQIFIEPNTFSANSIVSTSRLASLFSATTGNPMPGGNALPGGLSFDFTGLVQRSIRFAVSRLDRRRQASDMMIRQAWLNKLTGNWETICVAPVTTPANADRVEVDVPASVFNNPGFNPNGGCDSSIPVTSCTASGGAIALFEVPMDSCPGEEVVDRGGGGLGGGEIAGIVIGSVVGAALCAAAAFFLARKKSSGSKGAYQPQPTGTSSDFVMAPAPAAPPSQPSMQRPMDYPMRGSAPPMGSQGPHMGSQGPYMGSQGPMMPPPPGVMPPPPGWAPVPSPPLFPAVQAYNRPPVTVWNPEQQFPGMAPPPGMGMPMGMPPPFMGSPPPMMGSPPPGFYPGPPMY